MLDCLNLRQHVDVHTYNHGHTLDLVITADLTGTDLDVVEVGVSDHRAVIMKLAIQTLPLKQCTIKFRNIWAINLN